MAAKILIVEDEAPLAEMLRYNLESEGFRVSHAGNGEEAEILVAEEKPDLVVLDWMLPGVSGIEICRRMRSRMETKSIPIVMLTARGEEGDRIRGLSTGADDYVVKPFSLPELMARVQGHPAPRSARPAGRHPALRRHRARPPRPPRHPRPARGPPRPDRVPPARIPDGEPRPRAVALATARRRLGPRRLRRRAHGRRPRRPPAQGAHPRQGARSDPHRPRLGLRLRRALGRLTPLGPVAYAETRLGPTRDKKTAYR